MKIEQVRSCGCKCRQIIFCERNRRNKIILESYCEHCVPIDITKQYNVTILSEKEFRKRAGLPSLHKNYEVYKNEANKI